MQEQLTFDNLIVPDAGAKADVKAKSSSPQVKKLEQNAQELLRRKLDELTKPVTELDTSLLISATYDGEKRLAILKFYDPSKDRIFLWEDNTNHKPYAFSKESPEALKETLKNRRDIIKIQLVEKYEPLSDKTIQVSQIVTTDPLAIGGGQNSIRDIISAWEADIKYYENYIYDNSLMVGNFYKIVKGKITPAPFDTPKEVQIALQKTLASSKPEMQRAIEEWAKLLNQPLLNLKRAALDIEVLSPENRIPNPQDAAYPIVAVSLVSDKFKKIYLLNRKDSDLGRNELASDAQVLFYETERDLIIDLFNDILDYPIIATFNGDDFDLDYLYHRAQRPEIGLTKTEIPITLGNNFAGIKHGVHIDLYKTYNNKSLQVYAFGNKYSDKTLNGIAEALLGKTKIEFEGLIGDLPIYELARYNLQDADLTYQLVSIYNDVLLKLLIVIARIGKMPLDDLSRLGVSNWIRSMLYYEHRRQNALIPRKEELETKGGATSEAVIKGKKYKGGLVIDPVTGVHFNVSVLDFASLYPSIIKVYNISYETIDCPHPECRRNKIPDSSTWYCTKKRGIESLVVGSIRDLRVDYYKQLTRSPTLSQGEKELYKVVSQGLKVLINACFTEDTEILTWNGIKNIQDLEIGDKVVGINPDTMTPELDQVIETQAFDYDDDLYCFKNGKQVDLKVTKNHRMLVRRGKWPVSFMEARDIEQWTNISVPRMNFPESEEDNSIISLVGYKGPDQFAITFPLKVAGRHLDSQFADLWEYASKLGQYDKRSKSFICQDLTKYQIDTIKSLGGEVFLASGRSRYRFEFPLADFAELCGWIISEGYLGCTPERVYENGNHRGFDYRVFITQEHGNGNPRGKLFRQEIENLLKKIDLKYKRYNHGFRIDNPALHRFCLAQIGKGVANKRVPEILLESSVDVKRRLMWSLINGDGSLRDPRYTTASQVLANQFCSLLAQLGYRPRKYVDKGKKTIYRIVWCNAAIGLTEAGKVKMKWISKERFRGKVYCVTTQRNHTVFAGRNGIFVPVGQSYGVLGFESFPLYCLPAADAVATLGRYSITKTIEKCKELGIAVLYSDTDSLFVQAPSHEQVAQVTAWTQKELGIDLEVDKVYRYVAMSERKKNYFGVLADGTVDLKGLTGKKSVAGETPILAKVDGRIMFSNVAHIHECYRLGKKVDLLAVTDDLKVEWCGISEASQHKVNDVYLLRTSKGRILKLSGDHSIYVMDEYGLLICKETRGLKIGDTLVGVRLIPENPVIDKIDASAYVQSQVRRENGMLYSSRPGSTAGVPIPGQLAVSSDLMFLLGIYTAEGSTSKDPVYRNNVITQSETLNSEVCTEIRKAWTSVFGFQVKEYSRRNGSVNFYLPVLHAQFFERLCGRFSSEKRVPDLIFNLPRPLIARYLLGYFSGDGFSSKNKVNVASSSRILIEQIAYLLTFFDIDSRIRKCSSYSQLSVIGTSSRVRFHKEIGFLQPRFIFIPEDGNYNKELLPIRTTGLIEIKKSILQRKRVSRFRRLNMHDNRHYNMRLKDRYLTVISDLMRDANQTEGLRLVSLAKMIETEDVAGDEIVEIKKLPGEEMMYDFGSPKYERFVAGNLPTLLHNSQTPQFIKDSFYKTLEILTRVKTKDDFESAREEIKTLLKSDYNRLRERQIPMDQLAFNVMIGKEISRYKDSIPQHVRAAQLLQKGGAEIRAGDIISFVKTTSGDGAKPAKLAKANEIDVDKYLEYMKSTFDQILGSLGYDFDEILGATKLEDFFWSK